MKLIISPVRSNGEVMTASSIKIESNNFDHVVEMAINTAHYLTTEWYVMPARISVAMTENNEEYFVSLITLAEGFDQRGATVHLRLILNDIRKENYKFA